ncbi:MAG: hypothetical protein PVI97_02215 [Candidatus Thiodiazotropha sp.]|jgi:hypothetical protein
MKFVHASLIAVSLSLAIAAPSYAGYTHKEGYCDNKRVRNIESRLDRQYRRIERGIDRDRLTYKEAKKLKKRYRMIRHMSQEYREDGYLSRREYKHLTHKLDKNSRLIKEYTNDRIERYIAYHDEHSPHSHHYRYNLD